MSIELGDLVKQAKGDDRTSKEFSEASGVDAAIISKLISGKYVPQKTAVYRALTSSQAAPRNGVTYEALVAAAENSLSKKTAINAGKVAIASMIPFLGAPLLSMEMIKNTELLNDKNIDIDAEELDDSIRDVQKYVSIAVGAIYSSMLKKGISFRLGDKKAVGIEEKSFDTYLYIDSDNIEDYILKYLYLGAEEKKSNFIIENVGRRIIEQLVFLEPKKNRKVSVVVNCKDVYEYLVDFKDRLSYRGNLSVILVDMDKVTVEKEDYIAFYNLEKPNELYI